MTKSLRRTMIILSTLFVLLGAGFLVFGIVGEMQLKVFAGSLQGQLSYSFNPQARQQITDGLARAQTFFTTGAIFVPIGVVALLVFGFWKPKNADPSGG